MNRRIRVLMAKLGLDIHWRGVYLVSEFLKEAGMEVVYLGNSFPEQIVEAAIEEDADVVGLSTLSGNHMTLGPKVVKLLKEKGMGHVKVFMGGVMPPKDAVKLEAEHGIHKVYLPDTSMETIIEGIKSSMRDS
ncbi:MAG: cobalamin-dependent protein [Deltaproteobacteria bacterium]|nr:MAG: cobalamin-dependent protein [Deltaproteobacteria bacterium]